MFPDRLDVGHRAREDSGTLASPWLKEQLKRWRCHQLRGKGCCRNSFSGDEGGAEVEIRS